MNKRLSKKAVTCENWRWLAGMLAMGPRYAPNGFFRLMESWKRLIGDWGGALPDLSDPATKGCLLELVREAWDDPCAHVWYSTQTMGWVWCAKGLEGQVHVPSGPLNYSTEEEALVAALEASTHAA